MTASDPFNLQRFVDAQQGMFEQALFELRAGLKQTHWMWFIFPQLAALGRSATAKFYGIASIDEARAYREHPILRPRLNQSIQVLEPWAGSRGVEEIFGSLDALKLRSSLTLFDQVEPGGIFHQALLNFFGGQRDQQTLALLDSRR